VGRAASPALTGLIWSGAALSIAPFVVATAIKFAYNAALLLGFRDIRPPEEDEVFRVDGETERAPVETPRS
jgi:hypothetical protein